MKNFARLTLSIILGSVCVPAVFAAEFASDTEYAEAMANTAYGAAPPTNPAGMAPALKSQAATGNFGYTTDTTWQDALNLPAFGNETAQLGKTFQGNVADRFINQPLFNGINAEQGLMAIQGKFNRPACYQWGSGGFYGGGSKSKGAKYNGLPACSTTPCDIYVAE